MDADKATPDTFNSETAVRKSYRSHRYLQDLPGEELQQFWKDAFRNFMTINGEGKAAPLSLKHPWHWYWRVRLLHALEEISIRFGSYPNGFSDAFVSSIKFPHPDSQRIRKASSLVDWQSLVRGQYLVKYGQKAHLLEMLDKGLIRVAPASSYAAVDYNDAISDTELNFTYNFYNPTPEFLSKYAKSLSSLATTGLLEGTARFDITLGEDYYLFCLSASYDPRMFDDFEYDACMIIQSPIKFRERLMRPVFEQVHAKGWAFSAVTYIDPFSNPDPDHNHALCKHHRYSYQDELRAAWQMQKGEGHDLGATFVEIGSLRDIAYVVSIDSQ